MATQHQPAHGNQDDSLVDFQHKPASNQLCRIFLDSFELPEVDPYRRSYQFFPKKARKFRGELPSIRRLSKAIQCIIPLLAPGTALTALNHRRKGRFKYR